MNPTSGASQILTKYAFSHKVLEEYNNKSLFDYCYYTTSHILEEGVFTLSFLIFSSTLPYTSKEKNMTSNTIFNWIISIFAIGFALEIMIVILLWFFDLMYDRYWKAKKIQLAAEEQKNQLLNALAQGKDFKIQNDGSVLVNEDFKEMQEKTSKLIQQAKEEGWTTDKLQEELVKLSSDKIKSILSTKDTQKENQSHE